MRPVGRGHALMGSPCSRETQPLLGAALRAIGRIRDDQRPRDPDHTLESDLVLSRGRRRRGMSPRESVAVRVKRIREQRGMTQEQLAEKAGISRTYLARLETARHDPTLSMLEKIAKALRVDVAKLLK
jgi:DNA-binding XRE family transcriptional regulator